MNIPQFMAVLEAVVRKNVDLARAGRPVKDYLVPMAWGDPGLGKTDVVEAVAEGLGGLGRWGRGAAGEQEASQGDGGEETRGNRHRDAEQAARRRLPLLPDSDWRQRRW